MRKYRTVILGSGHFAVGYAAVSEQSLIVERTYLTDPELAATLSGYSSSYSPVTDEGRELLSLYQEWGIVSEERVNSPTLEVGLSEYARRRGVAVLFGTECTEVRPTNGGYEIELYGNAGFETVFAERVIDTRSTGTNALRVLLRADAKAAERLQLDLCPTEITDAFFDGECVLTCRFDPSVNVNAAKSKLLDELEAKLPDDVRVIQMAYMMATGDECALRRFDEGVLSAKGVTA